MTTFDVVQTKLLTAIGQKAEHKDTGPEELAYLSEAMKGIAPASTVGQFVSIKNEGIAEVGAALNDLKATTAKAHAVVVDEVTKANVARSAVETLYGSASAVERAKVAAESAAAAARKSETTTEELEKATEKQADEAKKAASAATTTEASVGKLAAQVKASEKASAQFATEAKAASDAALASKKTAEATLLEVKSNATISVSSAADARKAMAETAALKLAADLASADARISAEALKKVREIGAVGPHAQIVEDWNLAKTNGWYRGINAANAPDSDWWLGNVEVHDDNWVTQTVHSFTLGDTNNTRTFRRSRNAGVWNAWHRLYQSEAELRTLTATITAAGMVELATVDEAKAGVDTTRAVTPAGVKAVIDRVINGAPGALDALNELAAALGNDPNFANTVAGQIGSKFDKSGGSISGSAEVNGGFAVKGAFALPSSHGWVGFERGNADGASYDIHNTKMKVWFGLGMASWDGKINGYYDARAGVWDTKGVPRVNGQNVWYPGNFDPNTKANLRDATFTGLITFNDSVVVGQGQKASSIYMDDVDHGRRALHNNEGTIGFVGQHGEWTMRVYDNGDIWSRTSGWMSERINAKFDKTGGTVTGAIVSSAYTPIIIKNRTSDDKWHIYSTGGQFSLYWDAEGGNGAAGNKFTFDYLSGAIWCAQFGDLNTRIETRAREWADDRAQRITARLAYAGDLFDYESGQGTDVIREPYGGAVVTGFAGERRNGVTRLRFRYFQMKNVWEQWYTVGYA